MGAKTADRNPDQALRVAALWTFLGYFSVFCTVWMITAIPLIGFIVPEVPERTVGGAISNSGAIVSAAPELS